MLLCSEKESLSLAEDHEEARATESAEDVQYPSEKKKRDTKEMRCCRLASEKKLALPACSYSSSSSGKACVTVVYIVVVVDIVVVVVVALPRSRRHVCVLSRIV